MSQSTQTSKRQIMQSGHEVLPVKLAISTNLLESLTSQNP